jgi:hypothetical protein
MHRRYFQLSEHRTLDKISLQRLARALATEGYVSIPKYLAGLLRDAVRGDDLAKIHFYQDGSGDTYDVEEIRGRHEETVTEAAAGQSNRYKTAEEGFASFKKWKEDALREIKK